MTRAALVVALLGVLVAPGCTPAGSAEPVTVRAMTRNLYLGADIVRPIRATQGRTGQEAVLALGHANRDLRAIVEQTDFAARSELLAAEIADARPDLVGLQEVALWARGPLQLDRIGRPDATEVDQDFLRLLLDALAARDAAYEVVQVQRESDVEGPAFAGDPFAGSAREATDVRLTVRDVILLRSGAGITVADRGGGQYAARVEVALGGVTYAFVRGYAWADLALGDARFRFATTHLESQDAEVTRAQAAELVTGPVNDPARTTVVVCDCNADPAGSPAYDQLTGAGGFADAWRQLAATRGPGFTAALGERLDDSTAAGLRRRVDLVLTRPGRGADVNVRGGELTGADPARRSPTGLWASDHAGVLVELEIG